MKYGNGKDEEGEGAAGKVDGQPIQPRYSSIFSHPVKTPGEDVINEEIISFSASGENGSDLTNVEFCYENRLCCKFDRVEQRKPYRLANPLTIKGGLELSGNSHALNHPLYINADQKVDRIEVVILVTCDK
jgi:hypothetical protein